MDIRIIQGWCVAFFVLNNGKIVFLKRNKFFSGLYKGKACLKQSVLKRFKKNA